MRTILEAVPMLKCEAELKLSANCGQRNLCRCNIATNAVTSVGLAVRVLKRVVELDQHSQLGPLHPTFDLAAF